MATADIVLASARRYCMRYFTKSQWRERHFGQLIYNPTSVGLHVKETPLISVESITLDDGSGMRALAVDTDYRLDLTRGAIVFAEKRTGVQDMVILYTSGYDPIPPDLQSVLDAAATAMDAMAGAGILPGVQSVDLPDVGAVRFGDAAAYKASVIPALQPYVSILDGYRDTSRFFSEASLREFGLIPVTP